MSVPLQGWGGESQGGKGTSGPVGVLVWDIILGLGSWHPLCLISVYLEPLELLRQLEGAEVRPRGTRVSVSVSQPSSKPHVPLHIPLAGEIWIWGSLHSQGKRIMLKPPLLTFYGTFGQGVKVMDPTWKSRAPIQLGFDSALCQETGEEDTWLQPWATDRSRSLTMPHGVLCR